MLVTATKYKLYPDRVRAGTRGSYGVEKMEFVLSDDWDGLAVRAVFYPMRGKPIEVPYLGGEINIPAEVMRYDGTARYVLSGSLVNESGEVEKKLISLEGYIDVAYAPDDKGSNAKRVTADNYDLLLSQVKEIFDETKADIEQSAEQASNSAENAAESARQAAESESSAKANAAAASQAEYKAGLSASSATKSASDALISANDAAKFRDETAESAEEAKASAEAAAKAASESAKLMPVDKTDGMTQPVGRDEDGRLWTEPSGGGGGSGKVSAEIIDGVMVFSGAVSGAVVQNGMMIFS